MKANVFKSLEKFIGDKFPDKLDEILTSAGFDVKGSLLKIDEHTVTTIENFINSNAENFVSILHGTKYESIKPFKFLPGHVALITNLPEFLKSMDSQKSRKSVLKCYNKKNLALVEPNTNSDTNIAVGANVHQIQGQHFDEEELLRNLANDLLAKIKKYCVDKKIDESLFKVDNILELRYEINEYKCLVKCALCNKQIPCNYKTNWIRTNLINHLAKHSKEVKTVQTYVADENGVLRMTKSTQETLASILGS